MKKLLFLAISFAACSCATVSTQDLINQGYDVQNLSGKIDSIKCQNIYVQGIKICHVTDTLKIGDNVIVNYVEGKYQNEFICIQRNN